MKATVLGAGSWGTTFAQVLWDAGTPAVLWARDQVIVDSINAGHENPRYLPGISLPAALTATTDPAAALDGADLVVFAVPAQTLRASLASWAPLIPAGALQVSLLKGIELGSAKRMSEVIMEVLGVPHDRINVNGGAIAMGHPLGATGAMILGTLLDEMERRGVGTGLATLCVGAGMGTATIIERR